MSAGQPKVGKLLSNFWGELKRYLQAPDHGELDALRMTLIIGLHGGHKGCLPPAPRPRLAPLRSPPRSVRILRNWDGDDRRLAMTPIALTQFAGVEVTAFVMAAVGTDEVIRPA